MKEEASRFPMFLNIIRNAGREEVKHRICIRSIIFRNRMKYLLNRKSIKCSHKDRSELFCKLTIIKCKCRRKCKGIVGYGGKLQYIICRPFEQD